MNVTQRIEMIFSHAAALQQSGRLRNTVYCKSPHIFIFNQDHTVLLRFPLQPREQACFPTAVSFHANDYDSNQFTAEKGKVVFRQKHGGFIRDKACRVPDLSVEDVAKHFGHQVAQNKKQNCILLNKDFLSCLDSDLGHVEFQVRDGKFRCRQRNLYDGTVIITTQEPPKHKLFETKPLTDFPNMGMRTNDLMALFTFSAAIAFYFTGKNVVLCESQDPKMPFSGIISRCAYDELRGDDHGR